MRCSELDVLPDRPGTDSAPDSLTTELVAQGFDFPTSVAFADDRTLYVAESGLPFGGARPAAALSVSKPMAGARSCSTVCASR